MGGLKLVDHALAQHKLSLMRDVNCNPTRFRRIMKQASWIMCSEMTRGIELEERTITTPNGVETQGRFRDLKGVVIMPILRGGLVMGEAFAEMMPAVRIGHIGIYRDEDDIHQCYMLSLPAASEDTEFILLDPVASRGRTLAKAVSELVSEGVKPSKISICTLVISEPGVEEFYKNEAHKDVNIFAIAKDPMLNDDLYVLPGLGNVSARLFRSEDQEMSQMGGD